MNNSYSDSVTLSVDNIDNCSCKGIVNYRKGLIRKSTTVTVQVISQLGKMSSQTKLGKNMDASPKTVEIDKGRTFPKTPTTQASANEISNDNTCVVCFKVVDIFSIGECDHPVCYECSTRMRVLCKQNECPICRTDMSKVKKFGFLKITYVTFN